MEKTKILVTAPVRIDISGGWPDSDPYRNDFGGVVINGAINLRVSGTLDNINLETSLVNVPKSSGLGTSGALRAVYLAAANPSLLKDKYDLIKRVYAFENTVIGLRAGFQDEAASIFGGVNFWTFGTNGSIRRFPIEKSQALHFQERCILIYTGQIHLSANIHDAVFGPKNYETNILKIDRMKEIANEMKENFVDEKKMAELINETWKLQKDLHDSIETEVMKLLQEMMREKYLACRATGAGGGGCMIFYTNKKKEFIDEFEKIKGKVNDKIKIIPFEFDFEGIKFNE